MDNISFPTISDIRKSIILHLHPYHIHAYCTTDKQKLEECDGWKYELLQLWILPDMSVLQLRKIFPSLTFLDVVKMSLFYYPIPESRIRFDEMTLFYNACKTDQEMPTLFLTLNKVDINVICWTCYKFNRIDVLNYLLTYYRDHNLKYYANVSEAMINITNKRISPENTNKHDNDSLPEVYNLFISAIYMLSPMELMEAIIITCSVEVIRDYVINPIYDYLSGRTQNLQSHDSRLDELIEELATLLGQSKIDLLLSKYYPNYTHMSKTTKIPVLNRQYWRNEEDLKNTTYYNAMDYLNHPELVDKISKENLPLFHLSSGNYIEYIRLRSSGNRLKLTRTSIVIPYLTGYVCIDDDLEDAIDRDLGKWYRSIRLDEPDTYIKISPTSSLLLIKNIYGRFMIMGGEQDWDEYIDI